MPDNDTALPDFDPITTPDSIFAGMPLPPVPGTQETPGSTPLGVDPRTRTVLNILALLMGLGGAAGVGQNLFGQPPTSTITPRLSPQQLQLLGGAQGQFGQTGNMLQSLQGMIQRPQLPPGLSLLVEQAFQPQLGNLYSQAAEAGRRRGFHDAPATSPPGGAIFGPGLADLQGQMAQAKLNLYQNNVNNMLQALQGSRLLGQGQGQIATALPVQRQVQSPRPSILQTLGGLAPILGGIGGILGVANPPTTPTPQAPLVGGGLLSSLSGLLGGLFG